MRPPGAVDRGRRHGGRDACSRHGAGRDWAASRCRRRCPYALLRGLLLRLGKQSSRGAVAAWAWANRRRYGGDRSGSGGCGPERAWGGENRIGCRHGRGGVRGNLRTGGGAGRGRRRRRHWQQRPDPRAVAEDQLCAPADGHAAAVRHCISAGDHQGAGGDRHAAGVAAVAGKRHEAGADLRQPARTRSKLKYSTLLQRITSVPMVASVGDTVAFWPAGSTIDSVLLPVPPS